MTLMEEKTLADHDINVRSVRQELQLLEEQLKKYGRNEPSQSPTIQPDPDTISRKQAINEIRNTYRVMYSGDMISKVDVVDILNKLPPSPAPNRPKGYWTNISVSMSGDSTADCSRCGATVHNSFADTINFCPKCGADMRP